LGPHSKDKRLVRQQRNKLYKHSNRAYPLYSKLNRLVAVPHKQVAHSNYKLPSKLLPLDSMALMLR
tara:strand:+ start:165 stop:362 length:198 start_codon:yes stop_codon:yes gene_type:complete